MISIIVANIQITIVIENILIQSPSHHKQKEIFHQMNQIPVQKKAEAFSPASLAYISYLHTYKLLYPTILIRQKMILHLMVIPVIS